MYRTPTGGGAQGMGKDSAELPMYFQDLKNNDIRPVLRAAKGSGGT
jgi:hypothetical protein